jgi:periplasmic protein TonB
LTRRVATPKSNVSAADATAGGRGNVRALRPRQQQAAASPSLPVKDPAPGRKSNLALAGVLPPARIPPELLAPWRRVSAIGIAAAISVALHAVALTLHFTIGSGRSADNTPPLQIALVNAKSATKPTKAELLAQANLDGGGNTEQNRRVKSPLPVMPRETQRQEVAVASPRANVQENTTSEILTQLRSGVVVPLPEPKPLDESERTESPTANELMQRVLEAVRLEAQIARDMDAYQKIPRRKFIGAQAKEYRFARYVEDWRLKVERIGNVNYPEAARANRLYGSLVLTVSIRADGTVENVIVNKKSGQRILDAAAVKIVEMAGPYAPFPDDIRRDTDILHITRTWTFAKGDELRSD